VVPESDPRLQPRGRPWWRQRDRPPDRSEWHAEPVKVFETLYFVGQTEYSAWAVTTSAGIILIDTLWDYSVEDEVVNGLTSVATPARGPSQGAI
jgi:hypothetical protein